MTRLAILRNAALAAVAVLALHSTSAHAQAASYCGGKLAADTFYSTVSSNGKSARIDYFVQLRNTTAVKLTYVPRLNYAPRPGITLSERILATPLTAAAYAGKALKIGALTINNPSGAGAPAAKELGMSLMISCQ